MTLNPTAAAFPAERLLVLQTPGRVARTAGLAWLALAAGGIANGAFRQAVLLPLFGERIARVLSIILLVAIIFGLSYAVVRAKWRRLSDRALLAIGAAWAVGSALFEFGLGRLVFDMPWSELLAAYDLLAGQYWIFAPLSMIVAPALVRRLLRGEGP